MHLLKECILEMIVLIYIWDYNWIWMLNNNKNTFNNLFIFGRFNFWGNECIFEIKLEFLVIYEMRLFTIILFTLKYTNTKSNYFGVVFRTLLNVKFYNFYQLI